MFTNAQSPTVSVILTTHNRPQFLELALYFYSTQTYKRCNLVIVDDSTVPANHPILFQPDVQYIYLKKYTPLGTKLNIGIRESDGQYLLKMDDDDYYAPDFLEKMVMATQGTNPQTSISFLQPFLFLNLQSLQIYLADPGRCSGATLFFSRQYWQFCEFRDIPSDVDAYFMLDHNVNIRVKETFNRVNGLESFLQVRHTRHLWNNMPDGEPIDQYLLHRPIYSKQLKDILPDRIYAEYLTLRQILFT